MFQNTQVKSLRRNIQAYLRLGTILANSVNLVSYCSRPTYYMHIVTKADENWFKTIKPLFGMPSP